MTAVAEPRAEVSIQCYACRGWFLYGPVWFGRHVPCCPYCGVRNAVDITREASA